MLPVSYQHSREQHRDVKVPKRLFVGFFFLFVFFNFHIKKNNKFFIFMFKIVIVIY